MMYLALKHAHMTFALLSIIGFVMRVTWLSYKPAMLNKRLVRILPHINDTLLLASGVSLAVLLGFSPLAPHWFTLKLVLILVYICLGFVVMKSHLNGLYRFTVLALTIISFCSIAYLAVTKPPLL